MAAHLNGQAHSPPPFYNFAVVPPITSHEVFLGYEKTRLEARKKIS